MSAQGGVTEATMTSEPPLDDPSASVQGSGEEPGVKEGNPTSSDYYFDSYRSL